MPSKKINIGITSLMALNNNNNKNYHFQISRSHVLPSFARVPRVLFYIEVNNLRQHGFIFASTHLDM